MKIFDSMNLGTHLLQQRVGHAKELRRRKYACPAVPFPCPGNLSASDKAAVQV
jgi:hypothetical protein